MSLVGTHRYTRKVYNRSYDFLGGAEPGKFGWCFGTDLDNPLQVSAGIETVTTESGRDEADVVRVFGVMPEPIANNDLSGESVTPTYTGTGNSWRDQREAHVSSRGTSSASTVTLRRPMSSGEAGTDALYALSGGAQPTIWIETADDPSDAEFAVLWPYSGNTYHGFWFVPRDGVVQAITYNTGTKTVASIQRWKRPILPLGSFTTLRLLNMGTRPVLMGNGQHITFPLPSAVRDHLQVHYHVGRSGVPGNVWIGVAPTLWTRQLTKLHYQVSSPYESAWMDSGTVRHRIIESNYGAILSADYDYNVPDRLIVSVDTRTSPEWVTGTGRTAAYAVLFRHEAYTTASIYANTDTYTELECEGVQLILDARARGELTGVSAALSYPIVEVQEILHASDSDTTGTLQRQTYWLYTNELVNRDSSGTPGMQTTIMLRGVDDLLRRFSCDFLPHPIEWNYQEYIRYVLRACGIRAEDFFVDYSGGNWTVFNDPVNYDRYHPDKYPDPFALLEKLASDNGMLFFWAGHRFALVNRAYSTSWTITYDSTFVSPTLTIGNDRYDYANLAKVYDSESHETYWYGSPELLDPTSGYFYPFPVTKKLAVEEFASLGKQPLSLRLITLIGSYSVGERVTLSGYPTMANFDVNKTYRIASMRIEGQPGYCTLDLQEYLSETV